MRCDPGQLLKRVIQTTSNPKNRLVVTLPRILSCISISGDEGFIPPLCQMPVITEIINAYLKNDGKAQLLPSCGGHYHLLILDQLKIA
jgi:hypothetical protein